ncbi:hypothetical protein [Streptomyces sp. NPDC048462]|uniref:hypothetical protein n=1 Tax=Streptomyces sp. NPDC048462 TaxID=3365555 RepID=UPI00371E2D71
MHDDRRIIEARIRKLLDRVVRPAVCSAVRPLALSAWRVEGEPVLVAEALSADYEPFTLGDAWGSPWRTTWMRARTEIPDGWSGRRVEAVFDLDFDLSKGPGGQAEGLVHDDRGAPLQGLHPYNRSVLLDESATAGATVELLIELAPTRRSSAAPACTCTTAPWRPPGTRSATRLKQAEIAVREEDVWHLVHDIEVLDELMHELPLSSTRRHEILYALRCAADAVDPADVAATAARARALLADVLSRPAHASAHTLRRRPRAHRLGLAVAGARDRAQARAPSPT